MASINSIIGKINGIFTKADTIITNVGTANTNINTISTNVNNMFDPSKYTKTQTASAITCSTQNSWYNFIDITGKGYIETITAKAPSSGGIIEIKIIIDGVLTFYSRAYSGTFGSAGISIPFGAYNSSPMMPEYTNPYISYNVTGSYQKPYPYTSNEYAACILPQPLFFDSSLLIQVRNIDYSGKVTNCLFMGGIL